MSIIIGVLSDTHLAGITREYLEQAQNCFRNTDIILHTGDLVDISVLAVFGKKEVHAVHGNMCHPSSHNQLPREKIIEINGFKIALTHGYPFRQQVEDQLIKIFPEVDCIISGHTHTPVCHLMYETLFVNPGSFTGTGRYGAPGTYGLLTLDKTITGQICECR
jgi:uncharacterized protein